MAHLETDGYESQAAMLEAQLKQSVSTLPGRAALFTYYFCNASCPSDVSVFLHGGWQSGGREKTKT